MWKAIEIDTDLTQKSTTNTQKASLSTSKRKQIY